jgi:uncharacterized membrane protein YhiD involved in acid resistance
VGTLDLQDLSAALTAGDVAITLLLSFALSTAIGWLYQATHRGVSYTQSLVHTLVITGMVVAVVLLIVGSNLASAFALLGALSIIRFRNAVKETRDVGFVFFTIATGMAVGSRLYLLAAISTLLIGLAILIMTRFDWYASRRASQILRVQVPHGLPLETWLGEVLPRYTSSSELISVDSVRGGSLAELTYSVGLKRQAKIQEFLSEIKTLNGGNRVTLIAGYDTTDL